MCANSRGSAEGAALGSASHQDCHLHCALVKQMHPCDVYLNWGSAVVLPEVFLKTISVVRKPGVPLHPITTAMARVARGKESRGYAITGRHEIMMPLVAAALVESQRPQRTAK